MKSLGFIDTLQNGTIKGKTKDITQNEGKWTVDQQQNRTNKNFASSNPTSIVVEILENISRLSYFRNRRKFQPKWQQITMLNILIP